MVLHLTPKAFNTSIAIRFSVLSPKKWEDIGPAAEDAAHDSFIACNERCRTFELDLSDPLLSQVWHEMCYILDSAFARRDGGDSPVITLQCLKKHTGLGAGSNVGGRSNSFYSKLFDGPLTMTDASFHRYYRSSISDSPSWSQAEMSRGYLYGERVVVGNVLSFAKKNIEIARAICTEPTLNMFFQKGINGVICEVLWAHFGIDLSKQPDLNRGLALRGSIDQSFGTVDLKDASNCMALGMTDKLLPATLTKWCRRFRSPVTVQPDGLHVELFMMSSMGNGFTFPLQTLIFATLVEACYRALNIKFVVHGPDRNFGVFGDDIIVVKHAYDLVTRALAMVGFTVNTEKSFNAGPFRESCGGDFSDGVNVRGLYLRKLDTMGDVYSALNRIVEWSTKTNVMLPRTFSLVARSAKRFAPKERTCYIPFRDGDSEGLKAPFASLDFDFFDINTRAEIYRCLVNVPRLEKLPDDVQPRAYDRRAGYKPTLNPFGAIVSLVGGYLSGGCVSVREDTPTTKVVSRTCPYWDYVPDACVSRASRRLSVSGAYTTLYKLIVE